MDHVETPPTAAASPTPAVDSKPPGLLDQVRAALARRQTPPAVSSAYVCWIEQFIRFHQLRHPRELGAAEVSRFLSSLAVSQQQPLAAPLQD